MGSTHHFGEGLGNRKDPPYRGQHRNPGTFDRFCKAESPLLDSVDRAATQVSIPFRVCVAEESIDDYRGMCQEGVPLGSPHG